MTTDPTQGQGMHYGDAWLIDGCRTGFGEINGTLANISATDLGIAVAKGVLERGKICAGDIDTLFTANLSPSDFDAYFLPRHIGLYAGLDQRVPAMQLQRLCGSGFELVTQAADMLKLGKSQVVMTVGTEVMSRNPISCFSNRGGFKLGQVDFRDYLLESFFDTGAGIPMGMTAENLADQYGIDRAAVDEFAQRSFEKARQAQQSGYLDDEIIPLSNQVFEAEGLKARHLRLPRGVEGFAQDEHVRDTSLESLAKLRPSFKRDGVQTAGNSSGIVDGAATLVIVNGDYVKRSGNRPLARVVAASAVGVDPHIMGIGPAPAIRKVLELSGLELDQIDRFEINEAFGAQCLAVEKELGLDPDKTNVNGGATAYGHPLAATGVRCTLTLARELKRNGLRYGIASACVGGGQGSAVLIENTNT
ncbi:thiolase family protein [Pseudomaricurvus alkylphenolicus]|uniref:thiolase family protein n=1 Tax=Pseudomaricurvus alkylphenolicus TaxID=1306991 RepID=UPI00141F6DB8|nr:thiolase family protein [Pseudomaricurvus alkylphenolicus]NIB38724.1 thiolase family protein [Pseudomaricurvus alkylphenolicus]